MAYTASSCTSYHSLRRHCLQLALKTKRNQMVGALKRVVLVLQIGVDGVGDTLSLLITITITDKWSSHDEGPPNRLLRFDSWAVID
jgi:hypothetical protein